MSTAIDATDGGVPKQKRSRNGCIECRRLHRRCDEEKPECQNCRDAGKTCSYQKLLSWGGRPFGKSTFKHCLGSGVIEISTSGGDEESPSSKSFVYGQAESSSTRQQCDCNVEAESRSGSVQMFSDFEQWARLTVPLSDGNLPNLGSISWLSQHHRMLFHHFTNSTVQIFADDAGSQQEIRSAIIPIAVDTNHGFSLLAAILSLASTHRKNLGLHKDESEIEYWRDMSMGHLRRPMVQEDESAENVYAATALMLSIRDIISDTERPFSWKVHLQGAFTALTRDVTSVSFPYQGVRRLLTKLATSLQVRSLLPSSLSFPGPSGFDKKQPHADYTVCGIPSDLAVILRDIRNVRLESTALHNIESNSNNSNMAPLWESLKIQCMEIVDRVKAFSDREVATRKNEDDSATLYQLYSQVALLQTYFGVLKRPSTDAEVLGTVEKAMSFVRGLANPSEAPISVSLTLPLFTVGCIARNVEDRSLIKSTLARIATEHGKGNAALVNVFLEELWSGIDALDKITRQFDVDQLIANKGWDLSLW